MKITTREPEPPQPTVVIEMTYSEAMKLKQFLNHTIQGNLTVEAAELNRVLHFLKWSPIGVYSVGSQIIQLNLSVGFVIKSNLIGG